MTYHGGLGQVRTGATIVMIPPHSDDLLAIQRRLVADGLLRITPDGVISSSSSPTLTALRSWATSHGLSATGVARIGTGGAAAVGGLALRADLADAVLGAATAGTGTARPTSGGSSSGGAVTKDGGAGPAGPLVPDVLPMLPTVHSGTNWVPWAMGAGVAVAVLGLAAFAASRH